MTDNLKITYNIYELRKFLLNCLIKGGYKYIARNSNGKLYAYSHQPHKQGMVWSFDDGNKLKDISIVSPIFADIKWEYEEPFEIPCVD